VDCRAVSRARLAGTIARYRTHRIDIALDQPQAMAWSRVVIGLFDMFDMFSSASTRATP
jgi:hypothetical protein